MAVFKEEQDTRKLSAKPFKKIAKYALKRWPILLLIGIMMLLTSFYDASFMPMMDRSIFTSLELLNTIERGSILDFVVQVKMIFNISFEVTFPIFCTIYALSIIVRCLTIFTTFFFTNYLEMLIMNDLRRDSFRKVQQLSFSYFDATPTGWILARMENDTSSVGELLAWGVMRVVWTIFEISFLLITLFSSSWQLALIVLATTPIIIIITPIFQHFLLKFSRITRNAYSNFVRWLSECINGTATIKTLAIESNVTNEARDVVKDIAKKRRKSLGVQTFFGPIVNIVSCVAIAILILICYPILDGTSSITWLVIDTAIVVLFVHSVGRIYNQIADFSELYGEFVANQANAEKITSLIDQKPALVDRDDVIAKYGTLLEPKIEAYEDVLGDIEFQNVSFSYIENTEVLHNINLKIKQGTSVAIVGETGSGKTTTANLICRFYEPTSGDILIDGVPYRDRSVGWLRSSIAYVQQNPFVFTGTFKENITYGNLKATDEEVKDAAKLVDIDDFIVAQPLGYETKLSDGGNHLSVGQKQLLSFARAIIRDPKILILDEATSSIDAGTEAKVQLAMTKLLKNRTSIVIAHRLSTIVGCDRILFMENGKIIEDGSHHELMMKKGRYYELYLSQFKELELGEQINQYKLEQKRKVS